MKTRPMVSVLIPTYNCAVYLKDAIESVLNQTYTDFELIVIDNNSTDNTEEVLANYINTNKIIYKKNPENIGLVRNWNECLINAQGKYIKFLCADDILHSSVLEKFVSVMELYPNVALVSCFRREFGDGICETSAPFTGLHNGKKISYETLNVRNWLGEPSTVMFRRANLVVGHFKTGFTWIVDWEMWLRQLTKGDCFIIPEYLVMIRRHPNQITQLVFKNYIHSFEEYELAKMVSEHLEYGLLADYRDELKLVRKKKAKQLRKVMIKLLPKLYRKDARFAFYKAMSIIRRESAYI